MPELSVVLATEAQLDQAAGLRRLQDPTPVQVIAITSGKGGVGKTNLAVNLGVSMCRAGRQVMLLDADLGLANVDVMLGLRPRLNLSHVVSGECGLDEVILDGPCGLMVVPASSGVQKMATLSANQNAGLIHAFSEISRPVDTMLIDTAAGIHDSVMAFAKAAREIVVVVCDEPASITDAYALIKVLNQDHGVQRFNVLANMAQSNAHGRELFAKLTRASDQFLDVTLTLFGVVPYDEFLIKAIRKQRPVVEAFPRSRAAQEFTKLADKTKKFRTPKAAGGQLEFFIERLIQFSANN